MRPRRRPRSARCIARRAHDGRALAAKLQYPDMQSAVEADLAQLSRSVLDPSPHEPGDRDLGDAEGDLGAAARGARLRSRSPPHAALRHRSSRTIRSIRVPEIVPELSTKRLLTMTWLDGRRLLDYTSRTARGAQPDRPRHVPRLVVPVQPLRGDPRRPASRQLHRVRGRRGQGGRDQPARLWLHAHLRAEIHPRGDRSLSWPAAGETARWSCTPTRPGASAGSPTS